MFDEIERLGEDEPLFRLLSHYARAADRAAWQDRLMGLDALRADDLVRLHGELLAYDWLEQNTGFTPVLRAGAVPSCYRATAAGLRALRQAQARRPDCAPAA
jgi:hypothetical protein